MPSTRSRRAICGSSPLARGLPGGGARPLPRGGIIPARAGFTRRPKLRRRTHYGSSPLARGLPNQPTNQPMERRIIPARAGFTIPCFGYPKLSPDHPRSRGVYPPRWRSRGRSGGSSPLARGLRACRLPISSRPRIIPARAGFTATAAPTTAWAPDHPRSRGVYWLNRLIGWVISGSSPLARGLRRVDQYARDAPRIIPARAGFTPSWTARRGRGGDHPRSRGVYDHGDQPSSSPAGSSPLARGLPLEGGFVVVGGRIIPARAGFT